MATELLSSDSLIQENSTPCSETTNIEVKSLSKRNPLLRLAFAATKAVGIDLGTFQDTKMGTWLKNRFSSLENQEEQITKKDATENTLLSKIRGNRRWFLKRTIQGGIALGAALYLGQDIINTPEVKAGVGDRVWKCIDPEGRESSVFKVEDHPDMNMDYHFNWRWSSIGTANPSEFLPNGYIDGHVTVGLGKDENGNQQIQWRLQKGKFNDDGTFDPTDPSSFESRANLLVSDFASDAADLSTVDMDMMATAAATGLLLDFEAPEIGIPIDFLMLALQFSSIVGGNPDGISNIQNSSDAMTTATQQFKDLYTIKILGACPAV